MSPFFSQAYDFSSGAYLTLPFRGMPFYSAQFGAACGHNQLGVALQLCKLPVLYSPYELAVLETLYRKPEDKNEEGLFEITTAPDCAGTPHETRNSSWFNFKIRGGRAGLILQMVHSCPRGSSRLAARSHEA